MSFFKTRLALALGLIGLPATAALAASAPALMDIPALQARSIALGIRPTELEVKGTIAEIEGLDAKGRKVELTIDRRTGKVLHREFDN